MIKKSELWQRIRAARRRVGLRQLDVATHLHVDRTAITQWESQTESRRTRPDIDRLEEFARMTRTPLWWLLSDDVDISEPWPEVANEQGEAEVPQAVTLGQHLQGFWGAACLQARERREDLWDGQIWEPKVPRWMMPIVPDAVTMRAAAIFIAAPRPDLHKVAMAAASLIAFEQAIARTFEKKAVLIWKPKVETWPKSFSSYLREVDRISESAHSLTNLLQVAYLEVATPASAAEYLVQIL